MRFPTKTELSKASKRNTEKYDLSFVAGKIYRPIDIDKIDYQEKKKFFRLDR